jgi:hypothetical protein
VSLGVVGAGPPYRGRVDQWVSPAQAIRLAAADADGLVPLGDERLDEMLAGGLRAGELCGLYAEVELGLGAVRRVLPPIVGHCARQVGPVLYFALTPVAAEVRDRTVHRMGEHGEAVLTPPARRHSIEELADRTGYYTDRGLVELVVVDQLDAIAPDVPDADGWEHEAQITRDLKALARSIWTPILVTCAEYIYAGSDRQYQFRRKFTGRDPYPYRDDSPDRPPVRPLPADPLVAAADILLQTNGRQVDMIKNRHGATHLNW